MLPLKISIQIQQLDLAWACFYIKKQILLIKLLQFLFDKTTKHSSVCDFHLFWTTNLQLMESCAPDLTS